MEGRAARRPRRPPRPPRRRGRRGRGEGDVVVRGTVAGGGLDGHVDPEHEFAEQEDRMAGRTLGGRDAEHASVEGGEAIDVGGEERGSDSRGELTSRSGGTRPSGPPRAAQAVTPPSSTGRASMPCAARIDAATPARAPLSQIVTTGRSVGTSAPRDAQEPVRDVAAAGDVAAVALVALAHVDHLGALLEQRVRARRGRPGRSARGRRRGRIPRARGSRPTVARARRAPPRQRSAAWTTIRSSGSSTNPALVANDGPDTGTFNAPATWPARKSSTGRTSRTVAPAGSGCELVDLGRRADERPAVELDEPGSCSAASARRSTQTRRRSRARPRSGARG